MACTERVMEAEIPRSISQVILASSLAVTRRIPAAVMSEITFFSCCSILKTVTGTEKSCTAKSPPLPRTAAIPTAGGLGVRGLGERGGGEEGRFWGGPGY